MSLLHHQCLPTHFLPPKLPSHGHHTPARPVFLPSKTRKPHTLLATSKSSIFLPFLQEEEEKEEKKESEITDPIIKFFASRTNTKDPAQEAKLTLQKNRRASWHLSKGANFGEEEDILDEEDDLEPFFSRKQDQKVDKDAKFSEGIVKEIVELAKNVPSNTTLGEFLGKYEKKVSENECVELLEMMGGEGLIMGCLYFYEWMSLQEPSLVSPRACSVLFPLLGRERRGDVLMVLFQNLDKGVRRFRDVHVYNSAISGLVASGRYDDAWKVYEEMETSNIMPDHVTCSIMITSMRKTGRSAKDAWEFFEKMMRKGVKGGLEVMGALIKAFCDEGLMKEALIIQMEIEKQGTASNAIIYNTLMNGYIKSNHIEEAEGLFAEMKTKGIMPTSSTYNILMYAYGRRMQPEIVENLLNEMQDMNLEPNAKSYTCLISAYGRQRKMSDMAANVFLKMKKAGIKPTSHSYTALIHAYSVSGWHEKAYIAFENMQREGLKPSIETYTALLDAFRRAGDTVMLMRIWKMMISEKIEGTRVTFNTLLDGFAKQGHYIEARDVMSEFGKIGLSPTVMTYNMLMNAYARGGQHSKLPELLKEMAVLGLNPDSITYSTMIYAYVRVRDFKRAFFYHKQMVKSRQVPDARSYQKLRDILDVKAATKNRKDKSAILGIINSKFGRVKPKKKGKKDEFWKNKIKRPRVHDSVRDEK